MQSPNPPSFKPLTTSAGNLPSSMARSDNQNSYAASRAKMLLGCYRTGEANDPETFVAAVSAVLARYPGEVITAVTHPVTGLPSQSKWLPTIQEVTAACNAAVEPMRQHEAREKRIAEQLAAREGEQSGDKPTYEQLQAKYGKDWGLDPTGGAVTRKPEPAPSWTEVVAMYQAQPGRILELANLLPKMRGEL